MNKSLVGSLSAAAAGGGLLVGCAPAPAPPPPPPPVPALGCYTGVASVDVKIVGLLGAAGGLETYDGGSDCATNDTTDLLSLRFVEAADGAAALTLCQDADPLNTTALSLADWDTPAPGLAGYFACSDK